MLNIGRCALTVLSTFQCLKSAISLAFRVVSGNRLNPNVLLTREGSRLSRPKPFFASLCQALWNEMGCPAALVSGGLRETHD